MSEWNGSMSMNVWIKYIVEFIIQAFVIVKRKGVKVCVVTSRLCQNVSEKFTAVSCEIQVSAPSGSVTAIWIYPEYRLLLFNVNSNISMKKHHINQVLFSSILKQNFSFTSMPQKANTK